MLMRSILIILIIFSLAGCATAPRAVSPIGMPGVYHSVASGQTLYRIAKTYGVEVQDIIRANRITDPTKIEIGQQLFIPGVRVPMAVDVYKPFSKEAIASAVGPRYSSSRWKYITLHHSATQEGDAESFNRNHSSRNMGGLFYHFVIGNGSRSADGGVEVGWRWKKQKEVNRPYDIQICLVGNFNKELVSSAQFDTLVKLINILRKQYNIPLSNIRRHKDIKGKATECPGDNFPFYRLLAELKKN